MDELLEWMDYIEDKRQQTKGHNRDCFVCYACKCG